MKKVRIDWNRACGVWRPSRFVSAGAPDTAILPLLREAYGKIAILRSPLDVNAPEEGLRFLSAAAPYADELLLTLDGGFTADSDAYEAKLRPILEKAVALAPNLAYVELGDETALSGVSRAEYYASYRGAYRALSPLPRALKLGGNGCDSILNRADSYFFFLRDYAADTDPRKRLDFYAFHDALREYPVRVWLAHEAQLAWLSELSLPTLPIFLDSLCLAPACDLGEGDTAARNASVLLSAIIAAAEWPEFHLFPKAALDTAAAHTQFKKCDGGFRHTANAHAAAMMARMAGERLATDIIEENWPPENDILAVKDGGRVSVLLTNPTDEPRYLKFTLTDIPYKKIKITKYLVDDRHNVNGTPLAVTDGAYRAPAKIRNSENVEMLGGADAREELDGTVTVETNLRENAFCLYTFEEYA